MDWQGEWLVLDSNCKEVILIEEQNHRRKKEIKNPKKNYFGPCSGDGHNTYVRNTVGAMGYGSCPPRSI
jgi:hypothetical protein